MRNSLRLFAIRPSCVAQLFKHEKLLFFVFFSLVCISAFPLPRNIKTLLLWGFSTAGESDPTVVSIEVGPPEGGACWGREGGASWGREGGAEHMGSSQ